nr:heavy metal translocating P-type ATPase [Saccharopolyspora sp. HNM0983]
MFALPEARWAAAAVVLFALGALLQVTGVPAWTWWGAYLVCYLAGGWQPALAGLQALRDRTLDVDLLMVVAALGAASIGQITDGALLIIIFATSGALESFATARTEDSVRGLLDLAPESATRLRPDGAEERVAVAELAPGDTVLVRPGEQIGADGVVVRGSSEVDQATITGEPLPADKTGGDEVFAGTLNGTGALQIRVAQRAEGTVVARIGALVDRATRTKARTQLFIDRIEQRYSIGVVVATLAVFAVPLALGESLQDSLLRAMVLMIVASPCAVVLATMPPLLAAIANAGRHGVLVKSAVAVEQLAGTSRVVFDKTGTLTAGTPELVRISTVEGGPMSADRVLALAAAAEHASEHPLATAVVQAAARRGITYPAATEFTAQPGRGVRARVDGHRIAVGSPAVHAPGPLGAAVADLQAEGCSAVVVLRDGEPVGALGIADRVRPEAAATTAAVAHRTGGSPILLTGDDAAAATRVAERVGIRDVRAGLLPEDKAEVVGRLQASGASVTAVGDGINDAPALAAADAGVAMGGTRSDLTLQTADAVIVRDDLTTVPTVIALARRAHRTVVANLVLAGTCIAVLVLWDLVGTLPLPLAVAGHEGSTILVALNGLRLLRGAAWRRAGREARTGSR